MIKPNGQPYPRVSNADLEPCGFKSLEPMLNPIVVSFIFEINPKTGTLLPFACPFFSPPPVIALTLGPCNLVHLLPAGQVDQARWNVRTAVAEMHGCGSKAILDRCTTHFRTYFSGDWDVHWGYDFDLEWPHRDAAHISST